jgi:hypothetical protein
MEGTLCNPNDPAPGDCPDPSFTLPLLDYDRSQGDCTIVGGNVYRYGATFPRGLYFFGDFCSGNVWSLDPATLQIVDRTSELSPVAGPNFSLVGFGEDGFGRTLIVSRNAGVYRIAPAAQAPPGCGLGPELAPGLLGLMALRGARRRP